MVRFYEHLWVGEKARSIEERLRKSVLEGKFLPEGYYLILSQQKGLLIEILHCGPPFSNVITNEEQLVIGLAFGKRESRRVAAEIIEALYRTTGGFDLAGYLQEMR